VTNAQMLLPRTYLFFNACTCCSGWHLSLLFVLAAG
jgi:hypothetical protein